ncbi:MAG: hypothetical protein JNM43_29675 [Planctomycetaceae bacterium]|nr:hypothetical protein [Planctomycetaceae bacterium]
MNLKLIISLHEQLDALVGDNIRQWAKSRLPNDVDIADVTFGDFITIQPQQLFEYLFEAPRRTTGYWEAAGVSELPQKERGGRVVVIQRNGKWATYHSGVSRLPTDEELFATRDEAIDRAANRLWTTGVIMLNSSYCAKRHIVPVDSIGTAPSSLLSDRR